MARGFVHGYTPDTAEDATTLGLGSAAEFEAAVAAAEAAGDVVAVLFPSEAAVLLPPDPEAPRASHAADLLARIGLALDPRTGSSCEEGSGHGEQNERVDGSDAASGLTVVVLDGTYRQARQMNSRIGHGLARIKIAPERLRSRVHPSPSSTEDGSGGDARHGAPNHDPGTLPASDLAPLRQQGPARLALGRSSTREAIGLLFAAIDPSWSPEATAQWRHGLRFLVDAAQLQRGRPAVYGLETEVGSAAGYYDTEHQDTPGTIPRPAACPGIDCIGGRGFRNRGRCPGRPSMRSWVRAFFS